MKLKELYEEIKRLYEFNCLDPEMEVQIWDSNEDHYIFPSYISYSPTRNCIVIDA